MPKITKLWLAESGRHGPSCSLSRQASCVRCQWDTMDVPLLSERVNSTELELKVEFMSQARELKKVIDERHLRESKSFKESEGV